MRKKAPRLAAQAPAPERSKAHEEHENACRELLLAMARLHTSNVIAEALGVSKGGLLSFLLGEARPPLTLYIVTRTAEIFPDDSDVRTVPRPVRPTEGGMLDALAQRKGA